MQKTRIAKVAKAASKILKEFRNSTASKSTTVGALFELEKRQLKEI